MAKATCAAVASNVCASTAAAAVVSKTRGCENKRLALATMRTTLAQDVSAKRLSASAASTLYEKAARTAAASCRITEIRARQQAEAAARAAAAAAEKNPRTMNPYGEAYSRPRPASVNGLFGLGFFGL